ncbi:MAG: YdcF family protein [Reichenbachiella sp.]
MRKNLRWVGIGMLFFFSNPLVSKWSINTWEPAPLEIRNIQESYDWGVVLAGITEPNRAPFDRIHFNKGADRIVHAIQLYKLGLIHKILISGGSGAVTFEGKEESHALRDYALMSGVPANDLYIEDQSRNTRENALFSSKIIPNQESILLFTSAFHMRRATGCFEQIGLTVHTFPTDYYGGPIRATLDDTIIPTVIVFSYGQSSSKNGWDC